MADILQVNTELPADFTPTAPSGLTDEEAASRKPNISHHRPDKSTAQILAENLFTPFNGLNVALAVCLALVGSWRNMLFLGVVVSNTLIGTVQELRARKTIRKLSLLNAPTAHVLRNGQEKTCAPDALVKGDLVILRAGDQVMADAVVTSGQGAANESLLTGESTPMRKQPGDFLLSGSYILEGTFTAQLVYVGDESYAARLTRSAKEIRRPKSVLMTEVNRLIRIVSAALIPIGLLLFCKQFFLQHLPLTTAVPTSVAAMIGMIPEGLILLISVALAVGVIKLGKRNTLVQELYGIETLSRADVLCLDKTGTITTGKMTLDSLLPLSGDEGAMRTKLGRFLSSMDERSGTLDALRAEIPDVQGEKPVAVLPFSSERKKSAVSFADGTTLILGAPTFVLDDAHLAPIRKTLSDCAGRGLRVLVLAEADGCVTETDAPAVTRVIGLCLLTDEIRPAAQETLHYFHTQGVALKIISGDDEKTVAAIARKVGLSGGAVDASTLADNELPDACERYAVFGRVTPTRKKALVEALKAKGHHVAMTGDGVNDIPALKAADCSIAMAGGADATKQAAQLTLLDANFANMPLTGYSGGGKKMIAEYEAPARSALLDAPRQYALGQTHKHLKEMKQMTGLASEPVFCPVVSDFYSGMQVTVPLFAQWLKPGASMQDVKAVYQALYTGPVVSYTDAADAGGFLSAAALAGKDSMQIAVAGNEERMLLLAVYDNLGKGASGAAVECMNLVTGAEKTLGLEL